MGLGVLDINLEHEDRFHYKLPINNIQNYM